MILYIIYVVFRTSISGYHSMDGVSRSIYFLTNYYHNRDNSYYIKLVKAQKTFSLYHFNYYFRFKKLYINIFDNLLYPEIPFGSVLYMRGVKIEGNNFLFSVGKEREMHNFVPGFKKNYFTSLLGFYSMRKDINFKSISIIKKDRNKNIYFLTGLTAYYERDFKRIENKFAFSFYNSLGIADEFFYSYNKEGGGINIRARFNSLSFYSLSLTKNPNLYYISSDFYKKLVPNFNSIFYNIGFYGTKTNFNFFNNLKFLFYFKKMPRFSLSGGGDLVDGEIKFKRGFSIFYTKYIFEVKFEHSRSHLELNSIDFKLKTEPFSFISYVVFNTRRISRYEISYKKREIRLSVLGGEEVGHVYRRFLGLNFSFNTSFLKFYVSFMGTFLKRRVYKTLSFSISTSFKPLERGLFICEGVVFYDRNRNSILDEGDKFIKRIEIVLDKKEKTKTDKRGRFAFRFLRPGKHTIYVRYGALPAELISEVGEEVEFNAGLIGRKFILIPITEMGELKGIVFYDKNRNGLKDEGEKGVKNCVVELNGSYSFTDENGVFYFTALRKGSYVLKIRDAPFEYVYPVEGIEIEIEPGKSIENIYIPIFKKTKRIKYYKF